VRRRDREDRRGGEGHLRRRRGARLRGSERSRRSAFPEERARAAAGFRRQGGARKAGSGIGSDAERQRITLPYR
jgi:hypothetical protein